MENNFVEHTKRLTGHIVDLPHRRIISGELLLEQGKIKSITPEADIDANSPYILPGFIDSHIHIESSMLLPSNFAKIAVRFGAVGVVCDPHEIANVLGKQGVEYMINEGKNVNFHFFNGAPSCVPATCFETSGNVLDSNDVAKLLESEDIFFLSEMMNFPGVVLKDAEVMKKIQSAKQNKKPIDGHAPSLTGESLQAYTSAGITTDHECSTIAEAKEKIQHGMNILIREGSAARNFDNLIPLMAKHSEKLMFCSDDKHPDDLLSGHINLLVKRSLAKGYDLFDVLTAASLNPIKHYNLPVGLLQKNDNADFIIVDNLQDFNVLSTYINGMEVYNNKSGLSKDFYKTRFQTTEFPNNFHATKIQENDIKVKAETSMIKVMECFDGELLTKSLECEAKIENAEVVSDLDNDILKIVVLNRYKKGSPKVAFIKGFGFKEGAIASSIAHDSHNIIAVGVSDKAIVKAINLVVESKGGIALITNEEQDILPLKIAGLMSEKSAEEVAKKYSELNTKAKMLSKKLQAPYMTLAFMALLVIPELKLSDKGLFDGKSFSFTNLFTEPKN